jgi:hypothetical protein
MHVAVLSAIFPLGGMIAAPFAGHLPTATDPIVSVLCSLGAGGIHGAHRCYVTCCVIWSAVPSGLAFGAIVPLCLLRSAIKSPAIRT